MSISPSRRKLGQLAAWRSVVSGPSLRWRDVLIVMLASFALLLALPAAAQTFPTLSGRVVDGANILSPETETRLTAQLATLETQSQRQLVVATVASLEDYEINDYGYRLGRSWGIGDKDRNDGAILLIAPNERKMRIEVGYGLEAVLTDALSAQIIRNDITPKFRDGDFDGGVSAGVDAIVRQITLPPEEAAAVAAAVEQPAASEEGSWLSLIPFLLFVVMFIVLSVARGGKRYRGKRSGVDVGDLIVWGSVLANMASDSGSDSGGFGGFGGGGGGGFSGGGGSFGGGGASGGW